MKNNLPQTPPHPAAEQLRQENEARLSGLINSAMDAIISVNEQQLIVLFNPAAEQMFGYAQAEIMGEPLTLLIPARFRSEHKHHIQRFGETGTTTRAMGALNAISGVRKNGEEFPIEASISQVEANGQKLFTVILRDITQRLHNEARVRELEVQFLRAQRMESIGTLAGGIAHDLNNILSPLSMGLQMMQMKYPDEYAQKMLGMMTTNVQRGAEMVKQILQFARGVGGERLALQPKHIVKELIRMLAETLPKSIAIKQQLGEETALVLGDATQLHQVLLNLCVNARDAMPKGGTLTLSLQNAEIKTSYPPIAPDAKPGRYVVLSVADTGEGIAPEHLERIFDPFFTTKEQGQGTGLGLSTVFGIVRAHNGFITVKSTVGRGTQFKIHLPAHVSETVQPAEPKRHTTPVGQSELIMVVDDEAAIREMSRAALEAYGYRVVTASDGATAIALYAQHQAEVQLVLTDVMMPVMDGITMIRTLRKLNPDLRVICCSGTTGVGQNETLAQLNIQRILTKPLNVETLLHAVAQALNET